MHIDLFDDLPFHIAESDARPLSDMEIFLDAYGLVEKDFRDYWRPILEKDFHFKPRKPAQFLKAGVTVELGDVTVEIIGTPGHTPGHLSFYFKEPGILSLGDYDLTDFGPWYGDVDSNIEDTIQSVLKLKQIPAKIWFTGHETGLFEDNPGVLWDKYLHVIDEREGKLLDFISQPRTMDDIVNAWIVYGKPREPMAWYVVGERTLMEKHLRRLMGQGMVVEEEGKYCRA
jgi:glyoxylase-like metal-dependent hydrolase (beta-lactamase superfamily II)